MKTTQKINLKKIITLVLTLTALILIFCFTIKSIITTVPNYANKRGYEIVLKKSYEKYQRGDCLSENRTLSFEEMYRKALGQYIDRYLDYTKMYSKEYCKVFERNCRYIFRGYNPEIAYYKLDDGFNFSNWFELLSNACKDNDCEKDDTAYRRLFFDEFNATKVDPKEYLVIDKKTMTAGFSRPIVLHAGIGQVGSYKLYLDKSFILQEDGSVFSRNYIYIYEGSNVGEGARARYKSIERKRTPYWNSLIDNCGNIDFNAQKQFDETKDSIGKGG